MRSQSQFDEDRYIGRERSFHDRKSHRQRKNYSRSPVRRSRSPRRNNEHHRSERQYDRVDRSDDINYHYNTERRDRRNLSEYCEDTDQSPIYQRFGSDTYDRVNDTYDSSPNTHRGERRRRNSSSDRLDRSFMTGRDEPRMLDRSGDSDYQDSEKMEMSSSGEYHTRNQLRCLSYSPVSNYDDYGDMQGVPNGMSVRRESFDADNGLTWNKVNSRSSFEKKPGATNTLRSPAICKFYNNEGECKRGSSCEFLHLCMYYMKDDCKFGGMCKRSHNVLDTQPRSILQKHGIKLDPFTSPRKLKEAIKDRIMKNESKINKENTKTNLRRPFFENIMTKKWVSPERKTKEMAALSTRSNAAAKQQKEDDNENFSQGFRRGYIPLEVNDLAEENDALTKKRERKEKKKKLKKNRGRTLLSAEEKDDKGMENPKTRENLKSTSTAEATITFEGQNPYKKLHAEKLGERWRILNTSGNLVDLDEEESELFNNMYSMVWKLQKESD